MPKFQPGQSGNPSGKPKGSVSLTRLLREALEAKEGAKASELVKATIESAISQDGPSRKIVWERIDGILDKMDAFDKWFAAKTEEEKQAMCGEIAKGKGQ